MRKLILGCLLTLISLQAVAETVTLRHQLILESTTSSTTATFFLTLTGSNVIVGQDIDLATLDPNDITATALFSDGSSVDLTAIASTSGPCCVLDYVPAVPGFNDEYYVPAFQTSVRIDFVETGSPATDWFFRTSPAQTYPGCRDCFDSTSLTSSSGERYDISASGATLFAIVPLPAAAWLFVSALGLMSGWQRLRKNM